MDNTNPNTNTEKDNTAGTENTTAATNPATTANTSGTGKADSYKGRYGDAPAANDSGATWNIEAPEPTVPSGGSSSDTPEPASAPAAAQSSVDAQSSIDKLSKAAIDTVRYSKPKDVDSDNGFLNKVFENSGRDPVVNFNFVLRVEALYDLPCKAIKGIRRENEFEYIQEGGLNDYVHMKRKAISKPFTFQVERYVGMDMFDPLALGTELLLPVMLFVTRYSINFKPPRTYMFTGCVVTAKEYGDLDAERAGLLVETTTIAYRQMVCVDVPNYLLADSQFSVKKATASDRSTSGRNFRYAASNTTWETKGMYSKGEMVDNADVHKFDINKDYGYDSNGQLKHPGGVVNSKGYTTGSTKTKADMITAADSNRYSIGAPKAELTIDKYTGQAKVSSRVKTPLLGPTAPGRRSRADMVKNADKKVYRIYTDSDINSTTGQLKTSDNVRSMPSNSANSKMSSVDMIANADKNMGTYNAIEEVLGRSISLDYAASIADENKYNITSGRGLDKRVRAREDNRSKKSKSAMIAAAKKNKFKLTRGEGLDTPVVVKEDKRSKKSKAEMIAQANHKKFKFTKGKGLDERVAAREDTLSQMSLDVAETVADANKFKLTDSKGLDTPVVVRNDTLSKKSKDDMIADADSKKFKLTDGKGLDTPVVVKEDTRSKKSKDDMIADADSNRFKLTTGADLDTPVVVKPDSRSKKSKSDMVTAADLKKFKITRGKGLDKKVIKTDDKFSKMSLDSMVATAEKNKYPAKRSARDINKYLSKKR